jgi:hypothetical protein
VAVVEKVQQLECSQKFQDEEDVAEPEEMVKLQALVLQDDDCQFELEKPFVKERHVDL